MPPSTPRLLAAAIAAAGLTACATAPAARTTAHTVAIVRDVDGDTAKLSGTGDASRLRLIGIDTPETHRPGTPIECGGPQASASLTALLAGHRTGRLLEDPSQDTHDRYGRQLGYLQLDGRDVGAEQLRRGWATVYVYAHHPFSRLRRYQAAQADAKRHHRGVWARCHGDFHAPS